jgi:predicted kinase
VSERYLLIITGLPFSGKTTLTNILIRKFEYIVISVDEFIESGNYIVKNMVQDDWNRVYSQAYTKLKNCLEEGKMVIFDGGSLLRSERQTLKDIAKSLKIPSKLIYVNTTKEEIIKRRFNNKISKVRDQLEDITMKTAFDMFEEPTLDENPILYNQDMNLDNWIQQNINNS